MTLEEKKVIYDESFSTTNSGDNTLRINNVSDVATSKRYYPIGNLQKDENYIFDSSYNPMYCVQSYPGCNRCVSYCHACAGNCQTGCQNTCYGGCVTGCTIACQTCDGGCNGCQEACQATCQGCTTNCTDCDNSQGGGIYIGGSTGEEPKESCSTLWFS